MELSQWDTIVLTSVVTAAIFIIFFIMWRIIKGMAERREIVELESNAQVANVVPVALPY